MAPVTTTKTELQGLLAHAGWEQLDALQGLIEAKGPEAVVERQAGLNQLVDLMSAVDATLAKLGAQKIYGFCQVDHGSLNSVKRFSEAVSKEHEVKDLDRRATLVTIRYLEIRINSIRGKIRSLLQKLQQIPG